MAMSHFIRLPTELLQSIAEYDVDLTTLRLVCKIFNTAVFDAFAKHYFCHLQCFLLDKRRLGRLNNILLTSHLALHVKKVTLSLDPLEGKPSKDIPVALLPHFEDQFEIGQVLARMCMLESKFEPYMQREPPIEAISAVLQSLRLSACPHVALDCHLQTLGLSLHLRSIIEANADEITLNILQTLCLCRCPLSELRLNQTVFLDHFVEGRGHRFGLLEYCRSIKTLSYEADLEDLKRVFGNSARNEPPRLLSEWAMITVLRGASSLQTLNLSGPFDPRRVRSKTSMDYAATVLRPHCCTQLRSVNLSTIQCDVQSFWKALQVWKVTVQDLTLDTISLETAKESLRGQGWMKSLEVLLDYPHLSRLFLRVLYERSSPGDASPSLDLRGSDDGTVSELLDVQDLAAVQGTLRLNIEAGATFTYKIKKQADAR